MYLCIHTYIYTYIYVYLHIFADVCIQVRKYVCTHTHTLKKFLSKSKVIGVWTIGVWTIGVSSWDEVTRGLEMRWCDLKGQFSCEFAFEGFQVWFLGFRSTLRVRHEGFAGLCVSDTPSSDTPSWDTPSWDTQRHANGRATQRQRCKWIDIYCLWCMWCIKQHVVLSNMWCEATCGVKLSIWWCGI